MMKNYFQCEEVINFIMQILIKFIYLITEYILG